jgi:hypothetical protein
MHRTTGIGSNAGGYRDGWPKKDEQENKLELDGFTYERFADLTAEGNPANTRESWRWYVDWLSRDITYSPQPYVHLANALRAAGDPFKANKVLLAGRQRSRFEGYESNWSMIRSGRFWGLSLLRWSIGYGIGLRYFLVLIWVAALGIVGTIILYNAQGPAVEASEYITTEVAFGRGEPGGIACTVPPSEAVSGVREVEPAGGFEAAGANSLSTPNTTIPKSHVDKLVYSIDQLLPIYRLDPKPSEQVKLTGTARYYFYFHKIIGIVLAAFVAAGLTGLTQKP